MARERERSAWVKVANLLAAQASALDGEAHNAAEFLPEEFRKDLPPPPEPPEIPIAALKALWCKPGRT